MRSITRRRTHPVSSYSPAHRIDYAPASEGESGTLEFVFVLAVGLVAGTISGILGTGSSVMLVPVVVYEFGPQQAVPIVAVAPRLAPRSPLPALARAGRCTPPPR